MKKTDIFFGNDMFEQVALGFLYLAGIFFLSISAYAIFLMF